MDEKKYHVPVLLNEAIDGLGIIENGVYVDVTFGGGGHSREILKRLGNDGKLIAFDRDFEAHQNKINDSRLTLIHSGFGNLEAELKNHNIKMINGLLADLGVSSHQFDEASRGFSFRHDSELDMRMDNRQQINASYILNTYNQNALQKIFSSFGEVKNAISLAAGIVRFRISNKLETINDLKNAAAKFVDKKDEKGYYAKVFQALRIAVNNEMEELKQLLGQSVNVIASGGRLVIISYHSLEDRLVKNFISTGTFEKVAATDIFGNNTSKTFAAVNKKPVKPQEEEIKNNPRSRSAKLRIAQKL